MSAPSSAYHTQKALAGIASGASTFSEERSLFVGRFLQNTTPTTGDVWGDGYYNSTDTDAEKLAKIKGIFKLDGLANFQKSDGTIGFIGFCNSRTSANGLFHNWNNDTSPFVARGSGMKLVTTEVSDGEMLNDAGLNCKAEKPLFKIQGGIATLINVLNNSIKLRAWFRSAYYCPTTSHSVDAANEDNLNVVVSTELGTIGVKEEKTYTGEEYIVADTMIFYVGETYVLTLTATNSEGSITSSTLSLSPAPAAVNLKFGSTLGAAIGTVSASTIYINRRITDADASDGVIFYGDINASTYATSGYYLSIVADAYGQYKYYRVTGSAGAVTEVGSIVARHQDIYYYFSTISAADAIQDSPSEIILYYKVEITPPGSDFENRTYYVSSLAGAAYAAQGWYVKSDRTTSLYVGVDGAAQVYVGGGS